jgi:biotin transport system substrate-specific component
MTFSNGISFGGLSIRTGSSKFLNAVNFFVVTFLASILIALFGKARIFLPFSPIPIVLQMQLVYLLAFLLGPKKAACATLMFIFQAAIGLPVLPSLLFFTISKGYYIGYLLSAIFIGAFVQKQRAYSRAFFASVIGNAIVYLCGFSVFALYVGVQKAFLLGVVPFIIPDLIKNIFVIQILKMCNWTKKDI